MSGYSVLVEAKTDEEKAKAFEELQVRRTWTAVVERDHGVKVLPLQVAKTPVKDLVGQVSAEGRTLWTFDPTQSLVPVISYFARGELLCCPH